MRTIFDKTIAPACFFWSLALAGCGGSGSTGLSPTASDQTILKEVRAQGTCLEVALIEYCPLGFGAEDGAVVEPGPALPPIFSPDPPSPLPESACSADGGRCLDGAPIFVLEGFAPGSGCAIAARPAGSEQAWQLGPYRRLDGSPQEQAFPLPDALRETRPEIVLLCFGPEREPSTLPVEIETLAEAEPQVVFVPSVATSSN